MINWLQAQSHNGATNGEVLAWVIFLVSALVMAACTIEGICKGVEK